MNPNKDKNETQTHKPSHDLLYGIIAGVTCTIIYNPLDRALQNSQLNRTSLFISGNFSNPYQGVVQASMQRMIFGTAYYWMQGFIRSEIAPSLRNDYHFPAPVVYLLTGLTAGSLHGFVSNPSSLLKAQTWLDQSNTFTNRFKAFYHAHGVTGLFRGTITNMLSSGIYGGLYEVTRHSFRHALKHHYDAAQTYASLHTGIHFSCDLAAAFVCTAAVTPFTYARNLQYATAPQLEAKKLKQITKEILLDFKSQPGSVVSKIGVFSKRVKMIEMAARTALNMATGQIIIDSLRNRKQ